MRKLMMMLGILLAMPLFAADTPATLDTLRDQIASLTTTVNAMKQKIDDLRLGGAVGDIGAVKDTVTNQGVQVVRFDVSSTLVSVTTKPPLTIWRPAPTYRDHGGNIPGVAVHNTNGATLPAGTYLFRMLPGIVNYPLSTIETRDMGGTVAWRDPRYEAYNWWRWTGETGHATEQISGDGTTERIGGDVVWRMANPGVFTFASTTTIKLHRPNWEITSWHLAQQAADGVGKGPKCSSAA